MLTCHRHRLPPTNPHSTGPPPREGHVAIGRAAPGHHEPGGAPCRLGRRLSRPAGLMLPSGWRAPRRGARSSDAFERVLRSIRGVNHSGGRLQVMRSRKTACEPAPPTPSTHANVQTSKVSSRPWGPLTNFSCRSHTGMGEQKSEDMRNGSNQVGSDGTLRHEPPEGGNRERLRNVTECEPMK